MIKIISPNPVFLEGSNQGVLLLHSYTSTVRDVKPLAQFLNQHGFSCFAPNYHGHGLAIDEFIKFTPTDWFQDAINGYTRLKQHGCDEIAVLGVSLGGVLSLKMAEQFDVQACIAMSVAKERSIDSIFKRIIPYANYMNEIQGLEAFHSELQLNKLKQLSLNQLSQFNQFIEETTQNIDLIRSPLALLYGKLDAPIYAESAQLLYMQATTEKKIIKEYPNTGHLMTLGEDKTQLYQDILEFLLTSFK